MRVVCGLPGVVLHVCGRVVLAPAGLFCRLMRGAPPLEKLHQLQASHPCTLSARTCSAGILFTYPEPVPSTVFPFTVTQHKVAQAICAQLYHHINCCCRHLQDWQAAGPEGVKAYQSLKMLTFDFILQVGRVLLRHCGTC